MTLIQKAYNYAVLENGVAEYIGQASNPRVLEYLKSVDLNSEMQNTDETSWCSAFVNWCLQKAGGNGTRNAMARSFLAWGKEAKNPKRGDIVVFRRGFNGISGHVAFVIDIGPIYVTCYGGNQSDKVCTAKYLRANVLGYRTSLDTI